MSEFVPYSEEAERGALGSCLLEPLRLMPVAQARFGITEDYFYVPAHKAIWEALVEMERDQAPIDILTVSDRLRSNGKLERIGGETALDQLVNDTPTAAHGEYYLDIVRKKFELRSVIDACREGEQDARDEAVSATVVIASMQERFAKIGKGPVDEEKNDAVMAGILQSWRDASDGKKPAIGIETPWEQVTRTMCGLDEGVIIVAGRPSAGKTTLEDAIAHHAAQMGIGVARATLDSTRKQLLARSICRSAGISMPKMKFGFGTKAQHASALAAAADIAEMPIWFNDRDTDIAQICAWARYMKRKNNIGLLTVDYIQLVGAACMGRQEWDAVARVTYVSRTLKALGYELKIPVLVLSQLSRLMEQENREPKLSDLRDSGAIEQDANKVVFVYVDQKKRKEMESDRRGATKHKRPVWVNVMKHKDGETGAIPMWLYPPYFRFDECVVEHGAEPFSDDQLPGEMEANQRDFERKPDYFPDDEGIRRAKQAEKTAEQFTMPVGDDDES